MPPEPARFTVVGSSNLDLIARCERFPRPGETLSGATFDRAPGGKGANQAVALARLGARVEFVGCVGEDPFAEEAVAGLRDSGVDLRRLRRVQAPTGIALILVDALGENEIVVASGANMDVSPEDAVVSEGNAVLCQLEIPVEVVTAAFLGATGLRCLNAAPARELPTELLDLADLVVVNRLELEALGQRPRGILAVTLGADGAVLYRSGEEVARAHPPEVDAVDATAAGDAFSACLSLSLVEGLADDEALRRACAAGAIAASRPGAQPSLPTRAEVDAILA